MAESGNVIASPPGSPSSRPRGEIGTPSKRTYVTFQNRAVRLATDVLPAPEPGQILVRVLQSVVGPGTESAQLNERFPWWKRPDRCPGYSAVCVVDAVGNAVQTPEPGEVIYTQVPHASAALMEPAKHVWAPVPVGLDPELAALTTLLAIGLYGVRKAMITLGEPILVIGDGPIGLAAAFWSRMRGGWPVIVAGHHDVRLAAARKLGATTTINTRGTPLRNANKDSQLPAEPAVVILAAPSLEGLREACALCTPGGRVIILATFGEDDRLVVHPWHDQIQSKDLTMDWVHQPLNPVPAQRKDRALILRMLAAGRIPADVLITHRLPWNRAAEAYELLEHHRDETLCVVLDWTREE